MTEADMLAALEGHFYRMHYTRDGIKVLDVAEETAPVVSEDDDLAPREPAKRGFYAPGSIDWSGKDDRIIAMRRAGASFNEIARVIDEGKATVRARYVKLCKMRGLDIDTSCVPLRMFSPEVEAQIVKMRQSGQTFRAIAEQFGISSPGAMNIYYRWIREHEEAA